VRRAFLGIVAAGSGAYYLFNRQSRELDRVASLPVYVTTVEFDNGAERAAWFADYASIARTTNGRNASPLTSSR
jgi:hypothetical protein